MTNWLLDDSYGLLDDSYEETIKNFNDYYKHVDDPYAHLSGEGLDINNPDAWDFYQGLRSRSNAALSKGYAISTLDPEESKKLLKIAEVYDLAAGTAPFCYRLCIRTLEENHLPYEPLSSRYSF